MQTLENERISSENQLKSHREMLYSEQQRRFQADHALETLKQNFDYQVTQIQLENENITQEIKSLREETEKKNSDWKAEKEVLLRRMKSLTDEFTEQISLKQTVADKATTRIQQTLETYNTETSQYFAFREKVEKQLIELKAENETLCTRLEVALEERQRAMKWSERRDNAAKALDAECQSLRQRFQTQSVKYAKLERDMASVEHDRHSFLLEKEAMRIDKERLRRWDYQRNICI
jgi:hypothetical protein